MSLNFAQFNKYLLLGLIGLLSSCDSYFQIVLKKPEAYKKEKVVRFEKYITNSSLLSCGISFDKKLFCNEQKTKNGSSLFEQKIDSGLPIKMIEAGRNHICGVFEGPIFDEVWCKGTGTSGQLGDGLSITSDKLVKVVGLPEKRVINLGFGNNASCAVTDDKKVYCWGSGYFPTNVASPSATAIETPMSGVEEIKGNYANFCALKDDQSLWCWGTGANGILGQGNVSNSYYVPLKVKDSVGTGYLSDITDFAVGYHHACAIIDAEVYCWGFSRRIGLDQDAATTLPRHFPELSGAIKIEAGDYHTCAQLNTKEIYCWGQNRSLEVGGTQDLLVIIPKKIDFPASVGEIVDLTLSNGTNPSNGRTCVVNKAGEVYCWGTTSNGVFGSLAPLIESNFKLQPFSNVQKIKIGQNQLCFMSENKFFSSGFNDYDQFVSDRYVITRPIAMSDLDVEDFSCSRYANCFVSDSKLYCRGLNYTDRKEVTSLGSDVKETYAASHSTCALMNNNELKCWGRSTYGEIGNGGVAAVIENSPYTSLTNVATAAAGSNLICALSLDHKISCWGNNVSGAVGHDNSGDANMKVPTLVVGLPDLSLATKIKLKIHYHTVCLQVDNDIYCWGAEIGGLLQDGNDHSFKAQKMSALSGDIQKIAVIDKGVCASYLNNTISCLVRNNSTLIVFNEGASVHKKTYSTFQSSAPIQDIEGGSNLLCVTLTDGKLYCLGNNSNGGMSHNGIKPALVLTPEKWVP